MRARSDVHGGVPLVSGENGKLDRGLSRSCFRARRRWRGAGGPRVGVPFRRAGPPFRCGMVPGSPLSMEASRFRAAGPPGARCSVSSVGLFCTCFGRVWGCAFLGPGRACKTWQAFVRHGTADRHHAIDAGAAASLRVPSEQGSTEGHPNTLSPRAPPSWRPAERKRQPRAQSRLAPTAYAPLAACASWYFLMSSSCLSRGHGWWNLYSIEYSPLPCVAERRSLE
mmetsp:Transcript_26933/g.68499  ORF Transcript_26933/g.68499 Transcript_26933/m.68499 type:complete len:225 (-) Transcript_26933:2104-2778(-)